MGDPKTANLCVAPASPVCDPGIQSCLPFDTVSEVPGEEPTFSSPQEPGNPLVCSGSSAPVLTQGQAQFWGFPGFNPSVSPPQAPFDQEELPILSPTLLEKILIRPADKGRFKEPAEPPPSTAISLIERSSGTIEVSSQYFQRVERGIKSVEKLPELLPKIASETDPKTRKTLIDHSVTLNNQFGKAAAAVLDTHTRNNLSEYQTIENWVHGLYRQRNGNFPEVPIAPSNECTTEINESRPVELKGVMLGFNLAGINKRDHNYKRGTGTVLKFLLEFVAREVAPNPKFNGRSLGIWGTNVAVEGIAEGDVGAFRKKVEERIKHYLSRESLPKEVAQRVLGVNGNLSAGRRDLPMESPHIETNTLKAKNWLLRKFQRLGLKAGWYSTTIDMQDIKPGEVELRVISTLERMAEAEAEARRKHHKTFEGPVPENSPVRGRAGLSLLRAKPVLTNPPHETKPVSPGQYQARLTAEEIRAGRLPNPSREGSLPKYYHEQIQKALVAIKDYSQKGDLESMRSELKALETFLKAPSSSRQSDPNKMEIGAKLRQTYEASLQQHRFPGVHRLEFFPELARRYFAGEKFYLQVFEYRDYWAHNREHSPDAKDSLHRLTIDIQTKGFRYHGLDVLVGTNGGDEIRHAFRARTADGKELTATDVARINEYLASNFNRIFSVLEHHEVVKAPLGDAIGLHEGRPYVVRNRRIFIQEAGPEPLQKKALLRAIKLAHDLDFKMGEIISVKDLSKKFQTERLRLWRRVTDAGETLEILVPEGKTPEGFYQVRIPLTTTITPALAIEADASTELVERGMNCLDEMAEVMKRAGIDRPPSVEVYEALKAQGKKVVPPVLDIKTVDRIASSKLGQKSLKAGANGGLFLAGEFGSELLMVPFGGKPSHYLTSKGMKELGLTGAGIFAGAWAGEKSTRWLLGASSNGFPAGWRGWAVRGGGFLGPLLVLSALHSENGSPQLGDMAHMGWNMGKAMVVVRGSSMAIGRAMAHLGNATRLPWLAELRGLTSKGGWAGFAATAALIVGEFAYLKYQGLQEMEEAIAELISESEQELAKSMLRLERIISEGGLRDPQGELIKDKVHKLKEAFQEVIRQQDSHFEILMISSTEIGLEYFQANQRLVKAKETQKKESKQLEVEQAKWNFRLFFAPPAIGERSPERRLEDAEEELKRAQEHYQKVLKSYKTLHTQTKQNRPKDPATVPLLVQSQEKVTLEDYQKTFKKDPAEFHFQSENYLKSRSHWISQIEAQL